MKHLLLSVLLLFSCALQMLAAPEGGEGNAEASELIANSKEIVYTNPEQAAYYATKAIQLLSKEEKIGQKSDQKAEALLTYSFADRKSTRLNSSHL